MRNIFLNDHEESAFYKRTLFNIFIAFISDLLSCLVFLKWTTNFWNTLLLIAWLKKGSIFSNKFCTSLTTFNIGFVYLQQPNTVAKKVPMKKSRFYFILKLSERLLTSYKIKVWTCSFPRVYFFDSFVWRLSEGFYLYFVLRYYMNFWGVSWAKQLKKSKAFSTPLSI